MFHASTDDGVHQSSTSIKGAGHITWVIESPDSMWHAYKIATPDASWIAHSCEITNL